VARWKIIVDPLRQHPTGDRELWVAVVESVDEPTSRVVMHVHVDSTARAVDRSSMPGGVRAALADIAVCIEATLDDARPPTDIYISRDSIRQKHESRAA
jgi:hypothetical protein